MRRARDFVNKKLEIENAVLRRIIDTALKDLMDDECNASARILSAEFTLAGADHEVKEEIQRYLESTKRGSFHPRQKKDPNENLSRFYYRTGKEKMQ